MSDNVHRPGLWPIPGEGVLARQGDLVLLASVTDSEFADSLLALLEKTAETGGDGRQLVSAVDEAVAIKVTWPAVLDQPGLAVVAFGPAGPGLTLTICGAACAEITTADGAQRLLPGQPGMQLRCVLSRSAAAVRSELGVGCITGGSTDRFSHLDRGAIRAGGLVYIPEGISALPPSAESAPPAEPVADPELTELTGATATRRDAAEGTPAATPAPAAPPEPADDDRGAAQPFESVLLLGGVLDEVDQRPALPLGQASPDPPARAVAPPPTVVGVYCKNGHFDDPEARFCAVCGISMTQQTLVPKPGPRPPLGVLAFDDGSIFQLDSDYVIGRDPGLSPSVVAGQARPLCIADDAGIVSRAHVGVKLDGWRVLVTDLGSANGTRIRQRDDEPDQPLPPRVSTELLPGSHVDLGGHGFRYESHRGH